MSLEPNKISFQEIGINALGALVSWIAWGVTILVMLFILWNFITIPQAMENYGFSSGGVLFPIILSAVTLIWSSVSVFLGTKILAAISGQRYKNNRVTSTQLGVFMIFLYIIFTPVYIWVSITAYQSLMLVFLIHVLVLMMAVSIILETMNNYRYIIVWIYGSFLGLIISGLITLTLFTQLDTGLTKLIILILLLPIIQSTTLASKQIFEYLYRSYYVYSGNDILWDIFDRIQQEENEKLRDEEAENII